MEINFPKKNVVWRKNLYFSLMKRAFVPTRSPIRQRGSRKSIRPPDGEETSVPLALCPANAFAHGKAESRRSALRCPWSYLRPPRPAPPPRVLGPLKPPPDGRDAPPKPLRLDPPKLLRPAPPKPPELGRPPKPDPPPKPPGPPPRGGRGPGPKGPSWRGGRGPGPKGSRGGRGRVMSWIMCEPIIHRNHLPSPPCLLR